jgi:hypothetical protein
MSGLSEAACAGLRKNTSLSELILRWSTDPGVTAHWADEATSALDGKIRVFGQQWQMTEEGVPDWHLDPLTGYRWPQDYCFDVPMAPRHAEPVEVKYVWELNRLLYLLPLAAHFATQHDEAVARLCRLHLESWIRAHPPRVGVTWRSGIELAHRVLVFVLVLELTSSGNDEDESLERLVSQEIAEHVDWIRRFPSRYSSANNHRVTELVALLIAASAYPHLARVDELAGWWAELDTVVGLQFHPDGVPMEQATMYALQVLEWVAVSLRLAGGHGFQFSPATRERISSAALFLATATDSGGNTVRIGDDDDSRLLTAALERVALPGAVIQLVADELGMPAPQAASGLSTFASGGYSVWRSGAGDAEVLWVLDHGPLGMGHLAAHAHADTLAVFLHIGGRPVFIDAGTYLYHSGGEWRDQFRSTAEHNTIAVGGKDSSMMAGPFSWRRSPRAEGRLLAATSSAPRWSVEAEHHGYAEHLGVVHRRRLEGSDSHSFLITDQLHGGSGEMTFRSSVLLAPDLEVLRTGDGWLIKRDQVDVLALALPPEWQGSLREEAGWYSPAFGHMERTTRLVVEGRVSVSSRIAMEVTVPPQA